MIRRPPRSTPLYSSAASDVYKRQVQGTEAPRNIIEAINGFNSIDDQNKPDVIIIARGGGSTEDLMAFNDEQLANKYSSSLSRAADGNYYEAKVPRTGAEDFSFFAQQVPGLFFFLGVNSPGIDESPTNHSPYFYVDDSALTNGVKAFINLVEDFSSDYNDEA